MKLCKDCKYFSDSFVLAPNSVVSGYIPHYYCSYVKVVKTGKFSPIDGNEIEDIERVSSCDCEKSRSNKNECGPDAIYFEPRSEHIQNQWLINQQAALASMSYWTTSLAREIHRPVQSDNAKKDMEDMLKVSTPPWWKFW